MIDDFSFQQNAALGMAGLPNRKVVRDALADYCFSTEFWKRIKEGKLPYYKAETTEELIEASYLDALASIKGKTDKVIWLDLIKTIEYENTTYDLWIIYPISHTYSNR